MGGKERERSPLAVYNLTTTDRGINTSIAILVRYYIAILVVL